MIMSGLEIHNAYPTLPFKVPRALTLGGWLAARRNGISPRCGC